MNLLLLEPLIPLQCIYSYVRANLSVEMRTVQTVVCRCNLYFIFRKLATYLYKAYFSWMQADLETFCFLTFYLIHCIYRLCTHKSRNKKLSKLSLILLSLARVRTIVVCKRNALIVVLTLGILLLEQNYQQINIFLFL